MSNLSEAPISWNSGWSIVELAVIKPLTNLLNEGLDGQNAKLFSKEEYMRGYTECYKMCVQRTPYNWADKLYDKHGVTFDIYLKSNVMPALQSTQGEGLLKEMTRRWNDHKVMNKWMSQFFTYLDRYYVTYQSLPLLIDAGLEKFKTIVFTNIKMPLTEAMVQLINTEREGTLIDQDLLRACVTLYEAMGMNSLEAYTEDFEAALLDNTRDHYIRVTAQWIQNDSTPEYMMKMEKALDCEKLRVEAYLNPETLVKMMRVLEEEGLEKRQLELMQKENSGCRWLLNNCKWDDLARMYRLFARLPHGLDKMANEVREHIVVLGDEEMSKRIQRITDPDGEKESDNDPVFIKGLLELHENYTEVVHVHFGSNSLFQKALYDAFKDVVNKSHGKFKNAELISAFCDRILKKGGEKLSELEVEGYLDKIVGIFRYLTDKDIFAEIYRNQLAKRFLNDRSISNDLEKAMIGKLKKETTPQFTSKMEGMMTDLDIGRDDQAKFTTYFKEYQKQDDHKALIGKVDFSVQNLTQGFWPAYKALEPNLPPMMSECRKVFIMYFKPVENVKLLFWQWSLGGATVKGTYGGGKKSYDFQVSILQAIVLKNFSGSSGKMSLRELATKVGISEDATKKVVHGLVFSKYKVLKRTTGPSAVPGKKGVIFGDDTFHADPGFASPMRVIRVPMASLEDSSHDPKRVDEDRRFLIQAVIVRIMKARKTLTHQQLIAEVLTQLTLFQPNPRDIKMHIESLIERDYLAREVENSNTYKYLA